MSLVDCVILPIDRHALIHVTLGFIAIHHAAFGHHRTFLADRVFAQSAGKVGFERARGVREKDLVLRTFRPGNRWFNIGQIQFQRICKFRVRRVGITPHALLLRVGLDDFHAVFVAASKAQIVERLFINREEATSRTEFRCHITERCLIRQCQVIQTRTIEFNEFTDHAFFTQHVSDRQHEVSRRRAFFHLTGNLEADNFRDQH